jgi:hypothetical protein
MSQPFIYAPLHPEAACNVVDQVRSIGDILTDIHRRFKDDTETRLLSIEDGSVAAVWQEGCHFAKGKRMDGWINTCGRSLGMMMGLEA